ncbi:HAD-IA family hydrolase [Ottowia sp.]|uniref:HAD family hydrolase n=1 Tax=Ottowia sp. TaxID=1898956 RepID=UPI002C89FDD6|nr:HAD-IA family hydrolase [Ottowia sp.]HOB67719.1 HAD-IA family hydrolase [Ottowia sp.]HPZ56714.1 HAD-IA family hydrolase [Ottowia sp.]HQD49139.1 HAD-IA family hydrolase [Ottowia sp.]
MIAPRLHVARIRAITLDLDDTLWPVWPTIERAEHALRQWLDEHAPHTAALARHGDTARRARHQTHASHPHKSHDLGHLRRETIRQLLAWAGEPTHLAEPAFDVFLAARQRVTLFDDALPALRRLATRYPLVALSNGNADVHRVGLGHYFHAAVSAAQVGVGKPDARIFAAGAQATGVPHDAVLHVGDDAHLDGAGALTTGMQMAWINRAATPWPEAAGSRPHAETGDLLALCDLLGV